MTTIATTLGALVQAEPALAPIAALRLSATSAYHVQKLARLVAQETKHFHDRRDVFIKTLGTRREDGQFEIKPDTDAFTSFVTKVNEVALVPVELAWGPITLTMLGDEKVSAAELAALGPLFDGEVGPA